MPVSLLFLLTFLASPPVSADSPAQFTPLREVKPRIVASSVAYPGGRYEAANMIDGDERTEYSSASKGRETFIDLDFGRSARLAGFHHVDRADPATVARSRLTFSNTANFAEPLAVVEVQHANARSGKTSTTFPVVKARFVRWQITELGPQRYATVGGAEFRFLEAGEPESRPSQLRVQARAVNAALRSEGGAKQPLEVILDYPYAESCDATIQVASQPPLPIQLQLGSLPIAIPPVSAVARETVVDVCVTAKGHAIRQSLTIQPPRPWELWFLPHSHNDIGYTHVQTEVEQKQWQYLEDAIELARATQDYPEAARFRWNTEVLWAVDSYLKQASPEKRDALIDAVRRGWVGLDALYGNELTALCSPEELFRLTGFARRVASEHDFTIDSAMISDVPGYTWGIVPTLAHSGVKYFSIGPNHIHRIGYTLDAWGDRPFYWKSPSGRHRILCWMAGHAYSWFHPGLLGAIKNVKPESLLSYLDQLEKQEYPYDMVQVRYSVGGDNGPPDPDLPEFVKDWNARFLWPKLRIATTGEMMREFERRYREQIPEARGDFTPYWEDGAASSARETSLVRNAAERLVQAETLWAMLRFPDSCSQAFDDAWRNVLLYNEHTWGAHCSISRPDSDFTLSQWAIKQAFARDASRQAAELLDRALPDFPDDNAPISAIDVFNTCSWSRSDLVTLDASMKLAGQRITTAVGKPVLTQQLSNGDVVFWAADVPPLGATRFLLSPGLPTREGSAAVNGDTLTTDEMEVRIDEKTGDIIRLVCSDAGVDLARDGARLNTYRYVAGRDPQAPLAVKSSEIRVVDRGPLMASLAVDSKAPGCRKLTREVRIIHGAGRVDLINTVDKEDIRDAESVHFGFEPKIPAGVMRVEIPWAIIQPERDQLPGACKNYLTMGRWVDVANEEYGLTWASVDAPLIEIGGIHVDVPHPLKTEGWIDHLAPTQVFYSYVMNNYWETNYKASQEGPTTFRYSVRPHGPYDSVSATRFGAERCHPLLAVPSRVDAPIRESLLRVEPDEVIVTSVKRSCDGKALIVRLFNVGQESTSAKITWLDPTPREVMLSSPFEEAGAVIDAPFEIAALGIVTLRAEL
jgi:hypothetical protein